MLIGKSAIFNDEPVIIVSDFLVVNNSIKLVVADSGGKLLLASISDLVLCDGNVDPVIDNPEFIPDWTRIYDDWLAMDRDGSWNSYPIQPTYWPLSGEWLALGYVATGYNVEEPGEYYIDYRHPNPSKSLLKRP